MIITGELTNSPWHLTKNALSFRCTLMMILHLLRMRRNVNPKLYNDRKKFNGTVSSSSRLEMSGLYIGKGGKI